MTPEPVSTRGSAGSGVSASQAAQAARGPSRIRRIVTTRRGGVSAAPYDSFNLGGGVGDSPAAVSANRARLAAAAGLPPESVVWMRQVHGTTVTPVDRAPGSASAPSATSGPHRADLPETDGIVTATTGLALGVLVADCVPMLAGDPAAGVIAAVHAGRRGAAGGIGLRMIAAMVEAGASVASIGVLLGPAICGRCYEVPAAMRDEIEAALPGSACRTDRGTPGLDLRAGLARQLRAAGVAGVAVDPRCTYTDPELFSHRRGAPTGRFAGLIWMPRAQD
ncbi:MAG TPA: peptidoglycan editing factor PgeF [Nakamurella sp.]|nr:peptidoglycan editing factor PgeF [Nakamurella sp.]